jgi:hypothetical protein
LDAGYDKIELEIKDLNVDILNPFGKDKALAEEEVEGENVRSSTVEIDVIDDIISDNISTLDNHNNIKFSNKIQINEDVYYKANVISNIIHCSTKLSKNRNIRVYGLDQELFSIEESPEIDVDNNNFFIYHRLVVDYITQFLR